MANGVERWRWPGRTVEAAPRSERPSQARAWRRADSDCGRRQDVADLGRLIPFWPGECRAERKEDRLLLLCRLRRALKDERRRGLAGHWAYDLARHAQLVDVYQAEVKRFLTDFGTAPRMSSVTRGSSRKPTP